MNKKILVIVSIICLLSLGIGAYALFNDTVEIGQNVVTAGTLDLQVDGGDNPVAINVDNIYPGWSHEYTWTLKNVGSITGELSIEFSAITNHENDMNQPEIDDGDTTDSGGELGKYLWVTTVVEIGSKTWTKAPTKLDYRGGTTWFPVTGANLSQNDEAVFTLTLSLPEDVGDIIQSDSVEFSIIFHLEQAI